jgi:hypothetical protein
MDHRCESGDQWRALHGLVGTGPPRFVAATSVAKHWDLTQQTAESFAAEAAPTKIKSRACRTPDHWQGLRLSWERLQSRSFGIWPGKRRRASRLKPLPQEAKAATDGPEAAGQRRLSWERLQSRSFWIWPDERRRASRLKPLPQEAKAGSDGREAAGRRCLLWERLQSRSFWIWPDKRRRASRLKPLPQEAKAATDGPEAAGRRRLSWERLQSRSSGFDPANGEELRG